MTSNPARPIPRSVREEAARHIYERYLEQVKAIIRLHVEARIRGRQGGTSGILQDAIKSFSESEAVTADPDNILPRFLRFVLRKCQNAIRDNKTQKRDVSREEPMRPRQYGDGQQEGAWEEIPDLRQLPALDAAIVHEELQRLSDEDRQAILMRMAGCTFDRIGQSLACSEPTARRRVNEILERWRAD